MAIRQTKKHEDIQRVESVSSLSYSLQIPRNSERTDPPPVTPVSTVRRDLLVTCVATVVVLWILFAVTVIIRRFL